MNYHKEIDKLILKYESLANGINESMATNPVLRESRIREGHILKNTDNAYFGWWGIRRDDQKN